MKYIEIIFLNSLRKIKKKRGQKGKSSIDQYYNNNVDDIVNVINNTMYCFP
jgi:hypothetical protein